MAQNGYLVSTFIAFGMAASAVLASTTSVAGAAPASTQEENEPEPAVETLGVDEIRSAERDSEGQDEMIADAIDEAFRTAGHRYDPEAVEVARIGSGPRESTFVTPIGTELVYAELRTGTDGSVDVTTRYNTESASVPGEGPRTSPSGEGFGSAYWEQYSNPPCSWHSNSTAWQNVCYKLNVLRDDGDPSQNWNTIDHFATAKSKSIFTLYQHDILSYEGTSADDMDQTDYDPGQDQSVGNCQSTTIGISAGGASLSTTSEICDEWDITVYNSEECKFKNEWKGNAHRSERMVEYMSTCVSYGGTVYWTIENHYSAA